jgi:hypothetical protein
LPEKGGDANAEAELFEIFGVQKDHDTKLRGYFRGWNNEFYASSVSSLR